MAKDTSSRKAPPTTPDGYVAKRKVGGEERGFKLPNFGERNRYFMLAAHPSSWDLVSTSEGWRLVPTLKRLILQAGVNFTKATEKEGEALDSSDIEIKFKNRFKSEVLLDVDEYLYVADGAKGSKGHFLLWENVKTYPDGEYEITFDADGYDLWRYSLVTRGIVAPPRDAILSQLRTRLTRTKGRATRTPHLAQAQAALAEAERRLAGLDEAVKALKTPAAEKEAA